MSSYNSQTTGEEVASDCQSQIRGKTVLITGASPGGLGAKFASVIANHEPACIILATRSLEKAKETAQDISSNAPKVRIHCIRLDLTSLDQVRAAAEEVNALNEKIDVIVNNAGIMAPPYSKTVDGIESQFATNYIGPFLFTNLLRQRLLAGDVSAKLRVVNVTSNGYRLGPVRFEDWNFDDGKAYNRWIAYAQSKSAIMLFTNSLAQKLGKRGVTSVSVHPGIIQTPLSKDLTMDDFMELGPLDKAQGHASHNVQYKSPSQGVSTHIFAAFHPSLDSSEVNGSYLADAQVVSPKQVHSWARDSLEAERLWELSEEIVSQKFDY